MSHELTSTRLGCTCRCGGRNRVLQLCLCLLILAWSPPSASAAKMRWDGTLQLELGMHAPVAIPGSGVATINGSGGGPRLLDLRVAGGIAGVGTIPLTDPAISHTNRSLRVSPRLGTGTLEPFWPVEAWPLPQLRRNTLPVRGSLRLCVLFVDCRTASRIPLSQESGARAVGVGGTVTGGGFGTLRISIEAAPWTVYSTTLTVNTPQGGTVALARSGWIHGPFSASSSAATTSGALQLVTPLTVRSNNDLRLPGFASLTIRFAPEPGRLLLIASGTVALVILRRGRIAP